jgi:hypothetical protein
MPNPPLNIPVFIKVYDLDLNALALATVTLTYESITISGITNSSGESILNASQAGASIGDSVTVAATKTGEGYQSSSLTLEATNTLSLTLEETSDYTFSKHDTYNLILQGALLTTYDGRKVTKANPLPIEIVDNNGINTNRGLIVRYAYNASNQVEYIGKAIPGTKTTDANWQIIKHSYTNNFVVSTLFAGGTDAFNKVWDNRTTYNYS